MVSGLCFNLRGVALVQQRWGPAQYSPSLPLAAVCFASPQFPWHSPGLFVSLPPPAHVTSQTNFSESGIIGHDRPPAVPTPEYNSCMATLPGEWLAKRCLRDDQKSRQFSPNEKM